MDEARLSRMREELTKARRKREDWDGRVKDLVAALVNSDGVTPEDLDELRQMFKVVE